MYKNKHLSYRRALVLIMFALLNIILFQNCGPSSFESKQRVASSLTQGSEVKEPLPVPDSSETNSESNETDQSEVPTKPNSPIEPDLMGPVGSVPPLPTPVDGNEQSQQQTMDNLAADGTLDIRKDELAFPGARGAAKYATGGRSGAVVKVTTREDNCTSGDGQITWREAIQACGDVKAQARTIVFKVGGVFHADHSMGYIYMGSGNITVACQTAPVPVVFTETVHNFSGHKNYIVRHCIHRNDGTPILGPGTDRGWNNTSGAGNAIFDHISVSWTQDSNWIVYQGVNEAAPKNFTLQYSNLSRGDGSKETTAGTYDSAVGPVCLGNDPNSRIENCSFLGNFAAHNNTRNNGLWTASGEAFDNVVYNWWDGSVQAVDIMGKGNTSGFWINNIVKPGPAKNNPNAYNNSGARISGSDNWFIPFNSLVMSAVMRVVNSGTPDHKQIATPSSDIRELVSSINNPYVQCNGASAWGLDFYDKEYWTDFYNGTGPTQSGYATINRDYSVYKSESWPDTYDSDDDGIADSWELSKVGDLSTISAQSNQDLDHYTDLEEFINERARCPDVPGI